MFSAEIPAFKPASAAVCDVTIAVFVIFLVQSINVCLCMHKVVMRKKNYLVLIFATRKNTLAVKNGFHCHVSIQSKI
jgi:hypothetical protein